MSEHRLANEMRAAQVLKAALLEVTDDPDAIADTIEGATSLHEAIAAVMAGIDEDEVMACGLDVIALQFNERRKRYEARIERRRNAIERAMSIGEVHRMELPQATLSLRRVPASMTIVSEDMIPPAYFKPQPPKLDKAALKEDLKAGKEVPGARMDNGGMTLSVRRA